MGEVASRRGVVEFEVPAVTVATVRQRSPRDMVEGRGRWVVDVSARAALFGFEMAVPLGLRVYRTRSAARQAAQPLSRKGGCDG